MRRKEERWLMILSILGVALILINFGIQNLDSQIQDVNRKAFLKQGRVNNDALLLINYYQLYNQLSLYDIMDANLTFFKDSGVAQYMNEDVRNAYEEYFNSNISDEELINEIKNLIWNDIKIKHEEYITHHFELENITYGSLNHWKNLLSSVFTALIIINALGYAKLFYEIKKRDELDKNKIQRKSKKRR